MKKYFVIDERRDGNGDIFIEECFTLEQANDEALSQWSYLTKREKQERFIYVMFGSDYGDDDTEITDSMFDSEEYEKEIDRLARIEEN